MAGLRSICMVVVFLTLAQSCVSQTSTQVDLLDLQRKMENMERKMAVLETRDAHQQKTLLEQQETIRRQGNIIADIQRELKHHAEATAELRDVVNKQQTFIKQQTMKMSVLQRRFKVLMQIKPSNTEQKLWQIMHQNSIQGERYKPAAEAEHNEDIEPTSRIKGSDLGIKKHKTETLERKTSVGRKRLVDSGENPVAFMSKLTTTINNVGINQNIRFDHVPLNMGGGYHNQHGLFIAPQGGIYMFSSSLVTDYKDHTRIDASIVKNGNTVGRIYGQGTSGGRDQGSVTVLVQVNQSDEIWVRNDDITDNTIFGNNYSSFSGYLLWPM